MSEMIRWLGFKIRNQNHNNKMDQKKMEFGINIARIIQMSSQGGQCGLLFMSQNQLRIKVEHLTRDQALNRYFQFRSNSQQGMQKKNWTQDQVQLLIHITDKVCFQLSKSLEALNQSEWTTIAESFSTRTGMDCMFKMLSLKKFSISEFPWDAQEDQLFMELVQQFGPQWDKISKHLYLKNDKRVFRNSKACKQHYACFLDPNNKKGHWSRQEDYKLASLYIQLGRKWSKIAKEIQGRNQNAVKNRFFLMFESQKQKRIKNQRQVDSKVRKFIQKYELQCQQFFSQKNDSKNRITIDGEHKKASSQKQVKAEAFDKDKQEYSNYLHHQAMNFLCYFNESNYFNCLDI